MGLPANTSVYATVAVVFAVHFTVSTRTVVVLSRAAFAAAIPSKNLTKRRVVRALDNGSFLVERRRAGPVQQQAPSLLDGLDRRVSGLPGTRPRLRGQARRGGGDGAGERTSETVAMQAVTTSSAAQRMTIQPDLPMGQVRVYPGKCPSEPLSQTSLSVGLRAANPVRPGSSDLGPTGARRRAGR